MKRQIFNCAYKDNTNSLSRTLKSFLASFIMIFLLFCIRHCRHISTCRLHLIFLLQFYHNIVLFYYYAGYVLQHFIIIIVVIVLPLIIQIFEASLKEKGFWCLSVRPFTEIGSHCKKRTPENLFSNRTSPKNTLTSLTDTNNDHFLCFFSFHQNNKSFRFYVYEMFCFVIIFSFFLGCSVCSRLSSRTNKQEMRT